MISQKANPIWGGSGNFEGGYEPSVVGAGYSGGAVRRRGGAGSIVIILLLLVLVVAGFVMFNSFGSTENVMGEFTNAADKVQYDLGVKNFSSDLGSITNVLNRVSLGDNVAEELKAFGDSLNDGEVVADGKLSTMMKEALGSGSVKPVDEIMEWMDGLEINATTIALFRTVNLNGIEGLSESMNSKFIELRLKIQSIAETVPTVGMNDFMGQQMYDRFGGN